MKQYLNFADSGNGTRTEQAQYIFTEFVPTHRDNGSGGQIHRGTGKRQKAPPAERTDGADLANLPLMDTMHHTLQAWCIFAAFVLTRRDNEDRKDRI